MKTKIETTGKYLQVIISCEITTQGLAILNGLIRKRLAFGGPVLQGPAQFYWKDEIVQQDYCFVVTYTRADLKDDLIREAEAISLEAVCMISFISFEGNKALIRLLDDCFEERQSRPEPELTDKRAALAFVQPDEVSGRTKDSFGDLTTATND